jgi:putative PIN family toxin of toxin-antitoxin system
MRAVLDTNVLISALITGGKPRRLLGVLLGPDHALILSEQIVEEFSRVSSDMKIRRYADDRVISEFVRALLSKAVFVRPESPVKVFDNSDDDVLSAAKEGDADFIVTGDRHVLELKQFNRTRIITVKEALSTARRKRRIRPK